MRMQGFVNLGWSPVMAVATTNGSNILQVVGWQGGFGAAPSVGLYVGSDGYKTNITDGVNIRGAAGAGASLNVSAGTTSNNVNTLIFSNSNGIAFGLNGSVITASYTVPPNQSNQTEGWFATGNSTQNSSTTFDARSITLNGIGGISVGFSNGSIQLSVASPVAQTNQSMGWYGLGNTTQNSSTTLDARTISLNATGGGISVGFSNGSVQLSVAAPIAQTAQSIGWYGVGNTTQNSSTTLDARTMSLNATGGGISVGFSNGSVQLSVAAPVAQTNQTEGYFAVGNTTQSSSTTRDARSISFNATGGGISVGFSNGSIQLSVLSPVAQTAQTVGLYALGNTTQNSSTTLDARTLSFNGLGQATVGYSNGSIQISVTSPAQTNQSIGLYAVGNTTQNSSTTLDARTLSFNAIGNGSIGYSNGSIQVSFGAGGGGGGTLNWFALGNTTQNSSTTIGTGAISLNGLGIITVGYSNGSIQLSATTAAQTNQTIGLYALGNTTQNSSTTLDARTLSFNGLGQATVGYSNGSIQISVTSPAQTNQSVGLYALGNTTQNSSTTLDARSISFNGLGQATVGYSNGSVQISVTSPVQTAQTVGLYALGNTTQNSSTTLDARTLSYNGLGIVTVGYSNGSIQISATTAAQTNQNMSLFATGNSTQSSSTVLNASSLLFNALGNGSIGFSNGSIQVSFGAGGGGGGTLNWFALGNTTQNSSTTIGTGAVSLNGLGIVTVGYSNGSIQISATTAAQTNQSIGFYAVGNTTQNSSTTLDARTVSFNGNGGMTVGYSNGSVQLSVPAQSSLSATGGVSIVTNGSTISIGIQAPVTQSIFQVLPFGDMSTISQIGNGVIAIMPLEFEDAFSVSMVNVYAQMSVSSSSNSSHAGALSFYVGVYSRNGSSLSQITSGSQSYQWTNTSSNSQNSLAGIKQFTIPMNFNNTFTGDLYVAVMSRSSTTNANWFTASNLMHTALTNSAQAGLIGAVSNASNQFVIGLGQYSATSTNLKASMGFSEIQGSVGLRFPFMNFANYTA